MHTQNVNIISFLNLTLIYNMCGYIITYNNTFYFLAMLHSMTQPLLTSAPSTGIPRDTSTMPLPPAGGGRSQVVSIVGGVVGALFLIVVVLFAVIIFIVAAVYVSIRYVC